MRLFLCMAKMMIFIPASVNYRMRNAAGAQTSARAAMKNSTPKNGRVHRAAARSKSRPPSGALTILSLQPNAAVRRDAGLMQSKTVLKPARWSISAKAASFHARANRPLLNALCVVNVHVVPAMRNSKRVPVATAPMAKAVAGEVSEAKASVAKASVAKVLVARHRAAPHLRAVVSVTANLLVRAAKNPPAVVARAPSRVGVVIRAGAWAAKGLPGRGPLAKAGHAAANLRVDAAAVNPAAAAVQAEPRADAVKPCASLPDI